MKITSASPQVRGRTQPDLRRGPLVNLSARRRPPACRPTARRPPARHLLARRLPARGSLAVGD